MKKNNLTVEYKAKGIIENIPSCIVRKITGDNIFKIEYCNKFMPKIDMAIVTGDLTDSGIIEEYETFNKIIELLEMPWFLIPGNHDNIRNIFK